MSLKFLYIDVETGGLIPRKNPILQLSAILEVDEKEVFRFNKKVLPFPDQEVDPIALEVNGLTLSDVTDDKHEPARLVYEEFLLMLDKYVNKYDPRDKLYIVGYNIHSFDAQFLRDFFLRFDNKYFGSYFWNPPIDVMLISAYACIGQRHKLENFKLGTVATSLGISIDEDRLHDAMYDVEVTMDIFNKIRDEYPI